MSLPTSRNTTYTPADDVKSNDLNDIQDAIVDHEGRLVSIEDAERVRVVTAAEIQRLSNSTGWLFQGNPPGDVVQPQWWSETGSGSLFAPVPLDVGCRVLAVAVRCKMSSAVQGVFARLWKTSTADGAITARSDNTGAAASDAYQTINLANVVQEVMGVGEQWNVQMTAEGSTTRQVFSVEITYDRP